MSRKTNELSIALSAEGVSVPGDSNGSDVRIIGGAPNGFPTLDAAGRMRPRFLPESGVLNVLDYGAKGDGLNDDTAAIQNALNALQQRGGGSLFFPAGTYMVMAPEANYLWLTVSSNRRNYAALLVPSNVRVFGVGSKSVLKLIDTPPSPGVLDDRGDYSTTHMLVNRGAIGLPKTIVNSHIVVHDLVFDGNFIQQSGEGVSFCGVEGFLVYNCEFRNSYYESNYFVFSRGGEYAYNRCYSNGVYQIDGGGPMVDSSSDISLHHNIITDSGYYAILLIDSYNVSACHNKVFSDSYESSAGYQAIRAAGCSLSEISGNTIVDSGFSAIWIHNGFSNLVEGNVIVHAGYAAGGGSNIHGITVDNNAGYKSGRNVLARNRVFDSNGAGIAVLEGFPGNTSEQENAGSLIQGNVCAYNGRDGIAVIGKFHRILDNVCESNGTSETSGIPGDGYNGIALNGARYCVVTGNTCIDVLQATPIPLNIDAKNNTTQNAKRSVSHTTRTQNYGIVEYPADTREEAPTAAVRSGTTVTVTKAGHTVQDGILIHAYNGAPNDYNGYFQPTVIDADHFSFDLIGNPLVVSEVVNVGGVMTMYTTYETGLGVGEVWTIYIPAGDGAGEWQGEVIDDYTIRLLNMPVRPGFTNSPDANAVQYGGGAGPETIFVYAAESYAADYNNIRNNVLLQNLANPTLTASGAGYKAYVRGAMQCGGNSLVASNLGHSWA